METSIQINETNSIANYSEYANKNPALSDWGKNGVSVPSTRCFSLPYFFLGGTIASLAALARRNLTTFLAGILIG